MVRIRNDTLVDHHFVLGILSSIGEFFTRMETSSIPGEGLHILTLALVAIEQ